MNGLVILDSFDPIFDIVRGFNQMIETLASTIGNRLMKEECPITYIYN